MSNTTNSPAVEAPIVRGVRALDPERDAFEVWCCKRWAGDRNALTRWPEDHRYPGQYQMGHVEFAWCAWQAGAWHQRRSEGAAAGFDA